MVNRIYAQGLWDTAHPCDLDGNRAGAATFRAMAEGAKAAVLTEFYAADAVRFLSLGAPRETLPRVFTIASLFPLPLETIDEQRVTELAALVQRGDAFWLPHAIPSVARSEPTFRPHETFAIWRGPVG